MTFGFETHKSIANNYMGSFHATEHLIYQGYKRIAHVTSSPYLSITKERLEGYKKAILEAGLTINPEYIVESNIDEMKSSLEKLFTLEKRPTALFAGNDRVFLIVMEFLREKRFILGKDIDIIVFDNIPFANLVDKPISFIVQPATDMGRKASELLFEQINKVEREPAVYVFPSQLI